MKYLSFAFKVQEIQNKPELQTTQRKPQTRLILQQQQSKAGEESDSPSSPDTNSEPEEPTQDEGSSSEDDLIIPAIPKQRGSVCMLTWSCPRHYANELEDRRKGKRLKPADMSKAEFVQSVEAELRGRGQLYNLRLVVAVNEKHKKYCIATQDSVLVGFPNEMSLGQTFVWKLGLLLLARIMYIYHMTFNIVK